MDKTFPTVSRLTREPIFNDKLTTNLALNTAAIFLNRPSFRKMVSKSTAPLLIRWLTDRFCADGPARRAASAQVPLFLRYQNFLKTQYGTGRKKAAIPKTARSVHLFFIELLTCDRLTDVHGATHS